MWSPDGKWICFKGGRAGGDSEIAAVSTEEGKKGFKVIVPSTMHPEIDNADTTIAWGGAGDEILVSTKSKNDRQPRLYLFDFAGKKPSKALPGISAQWSCTNPAWLPGGKNVAFSAVPSSPNGNFKPYLLTLATARRSPDRRRAPHRERARGGLRQFGEVDDHDR